MAPPQRLVRATREEAAACEAAESERRAALLQDAAGFSEVGGRVGGEV